MSGSTLSPASGIKIESQTANSEGESTYSRHANSPETPACFTHQTSNACASETAAHATTYIKREEPDELGGHEEYSGHEERGGHDGHDEHGDHGLAMSHTATHGKHEESGHQTLTTTKRTPLPTLVSFGCERPAAHAT